MCAEPHNQTWGPITADISAVKCKLRPVRGINKVCERPNIRLGVPPDVPVGMGDKLCLELWGCGVGGCGLSHAVPRTSTPAGQAWLSQGLPTSGVLTLPDVQSLFSPTLRAGNEGCGVGTQEGSLPPEAPKNAFQPGPYWEQTPCPTPPPADLPAAYSHLHRDFSTAATAFSLRGWSALTTPSSGLPLHWFYCSDL